MVWFRIGWMGVDLFFVISGFVIGLSAMAEIDAQGAAGFRAPFFRRRLARIAPLHYLTGLIFVAMVAPHVLFDGFALNALAHLTFLHNLVPAYHGSINGSNWSLGTEMQFYVLILVLGPWIARHASWKMLGLFVVSGLGVALCSHAFHSCRFGQRPRALVYDEHPAPRHA